MKNSGLLSHAAATVIVTILLGVVYVSVQQSHRSGANDPQLQLAKDIAAWLKDNRSIEGLLPKDTIEIAESLAIFVVLYDSNGEPTRSTGLLNGQLPKMPKGVFDFTKKNEEDVLTWQPRRGVRMAMVVESVQSPGTAFVAVGRSLMEVEKRESNLRTMVFIGWLLCLAVIVVHWLVISYHRKNAGAN